MKTVRELSGAGPCITLGVALRETAWRISYRDRHGTPKFISKRRWAVHTEPCPSCPDYPKTKYPVGYWDPPTVQAMNTARVPPAATPPPRRREAR